MVVASVPIYCQTPADELSPQMLHQLSSGRPPVTPVLDAVRQIRESLAVITRNNADLAAKLDNLSKRVDRLDVTGVSGNESRLTRLEDSVQEIRNAEDRATEASQRSADELKAWLKIGLGAIFSTLVGLAANMWRVRSTQRKRAICTDELIAKMDSLIEHKLAPGNGNGRVSVYN